MNFEKKAQKNWRHEMRPKNEREQRLWREIEGADEPIQTILKRINRILEDSAHFGKTEISTSDSCSGHIQPNGKQVINREMSKIFNKEIPINPGLSIMAIKDKNTEKYFKNAAKFLFNVFKSAMEKTNQSHEKKIIQFLYTPKIERGETLSEEDQDFKPTYNYSMYFELINPGNNSYRALNEFWNNVSANLSNVDNLNVDEEFAPHDFYKRK